MKKYFYIFTGIVLLIWSIFMVSWFRTDFPYLLSSFTSQIRVLAVALTLFVGSSYLYYGVRNMKINWAVDASVWILVITLIVAIIGMFFGCYRIGGPCSQSEMVFLRMNNYFMTIGLIISPLFLLLSYFLKKKDH